MASQLLGIDQVQFQVKTGKWATTKKNASDLTYGRNYGCKYKTWKKPKMVY